MRKRHIFVVVNSFSFFVVVNSFLEKIDKESLWVVVV